MTKVDLKAKPYNLTDADIQWVEETIQSMSIEEKIGQLFVNMGSERTEEYLTNVLNNYHIGAVRYNPGKAEEVYDQNKILQENSKIPYANCSQYRSRRKRSLYRWHRSWCRSKNWCNK